MPKREPTQDQPWLANPVVWPGLPNQAADAIRRATMLPTNTVRPARLVLPLEIYLAASILWHLVMLISMADDVHT